MILLFSLSLKQLTFFLEENNKFDLNKIIKILIGIFIITLIIQCIFNFFNFQNQEYWDFWQKKRFDAAIDKLPIIFGNFLRLYDGIIYMCFNIISIIFLIGILTKENLRKI